MENNLAIQELAAINEIDLGLKKLKEIIKSKEPIQPIDTTEGEFNYCVDLDNGRDKCQKQCDYCVQRQVVLSQKQAPIETEHRCEKYEVDVLPVPTRKNDYMVTICLPLGERLPKEEANLLADRIKQYLSTNKF
jgi:hypothetical protein